MLKIQAAQSRGQAEVDRLCPLNNAQEYTSMGGIAGSLYWKRPALPLPDLRYMTALVQHRGHTSTVQSCGETIRSVSLGSFLSNLPQHSQHSQHASDAAYTIVADAHLFNRTALLSQLDHTPGIDASAPDAALILAAYQSWGQALLDKLDGEFAFAIWDARQQCVFAARDPFGTRPFFYSWDSRRFVFGSEPKQLLSLPGVPIEPDDMIVGEYLFDNFEDVERTFFQGIQRLKPAHFLQVSAQGVRQTRYWQPDPDNEIYYADTQEYLAHFRQLFQDAVAKRLETDSPLGIQLSGGLDSSSVAVMAAASIGQSLQHRPSVATLSATFPSLACDESAYIEATTRQLPFRHYAFCPLEESLTEGLLEDLWQTDAPTIDLERGLFHGCRRVLSAFGARTVLTGLGGDELVHEAYYLRDLANRKQFFLLLREAWLASQTAWLSLPELLVDACKAEVPRPLKALYRRINGGKQRPPEWLNPDFLAFFSSCPEPPPLPSGGFSSQTQEATFQWLNYPAICWYLESLECRGAYHGLTSRYPFLDRPLAEFVLAIPFEKRLPAGQWKYLLRRSLADDLPAKVLASRRKTRFDAYHQAVLSRHKETLSTMLFHSGQWVSEPYVSGEKAQQLFAQFPPHGQKTLTASAHTLWRIATLECWLRQLPRYRTL